MKEINKDRTWRYDKCGISLPYYTKPFLDVLDNWDLSDSVVFEYGGGDSSIYYGKHAKAVYGVDDSIEYVNCIRGYALNNVFIKYRSALDEYINSINEQPFLFDIVIVDGAYRDECIKASINKIKKGGILIVDNWMQPEVYMASTEVQQLVTRYEHHIFKQPDHKYWQTLYAIIK